MSVRIRFGAFEIRPLTRSLLQEGRAVVLGSRAFDVLTTLVERRARPVSVNELLDLVWTGLVVEPNNLAVQIATLRRLLGASAIVTVRGKGYQFVAPVQVETLEAEGQRANSGLVDVVVALHGGPLADAELTAWAARLGGLAWTGPGAEVGHCFAHARAAAAYALHAARLSGATVTLAMADEPALHAVLGMGEQAGVLATQRVAAQLAPGLDADVEEWVAPHSAADAPRRYRLEAPSFVELGLPVRAQAAADFRPTLVIMPFLSIGLPQETIGIGDVFSDQLTGLLSGSQLLNVVSRLSAARFRQRATPLPQIARILGADFVVSGSCWQEGPRLWASVELAEARTQRVLWSKTRGDALAGVLRGDGDLLQLLAEQLMRAIVDAQVRCARRVAFERVDDHALMLGAIGLLYRLSPSDFAQARVALEALIERAPRHALPRAWMARWHLFRVVQGWSVDRDADGRAALDHARQALDLDGDSPLAMTMLGNVHTSYLGDLDTAERHYARAAELNPNESLNWLQWGNARSFRGDGDEALQYVGHAIKLSPLDPARHFYESIQASAALSAGALDLAIDAARRSLRMNAVHVSTHRVLAISLALSGRLDEARPVVRRILDLEPTLTVERFVARSPGRESGLAQRFGAALQAAGLPAGGHLS